MRTGLGFLVAVLLTSGVPVVAPAAPKRAADSSAQPRPAATRGVPVISRDPYIGLIAIDGATGKVLVEENADTTVYPASCIKLMTLFIIEDRIRQGAVHTNDLVTITAESAKLGASQVYLQEKEVFAVEDLIYALIVKSANDAAGALAIHVAGSQAAFVELMNQKAQALGMNHTRFYSPHGLPPTPPRKPEEVDVSTPRDMAILGRALVDAHPDVLRYTSTLARTFRPGPKQISMENHNRRLMAAFPGMDGLKTGYFKAAGYSSIVTAKRNGRRVFAVVAGSAPIDYGKTRDKAAAETLNRAFAALPPAPPPPPPSAVTNVPLPDLTQAAQPPKPPPPGTSNGRTVIIVLGVLIAGVLAVAGILAWNRRPSGSKWSDKDLDLPRRPLPPLHR